MNELRSADTEEVLDFLFGLHVELPIMGRAERRVVIKFLLDFGDRIGTPELAAFVLCPQAQCGHA
jgi:hypothetical protein